MAHMVEMINGVAQMAYVGQKPWHGLGVEVPPNLTPQEMLRAAGLDWTVKKYATYAKIAGKHVRTNASALVRSSDNKILDMITADWNPCQNHEAFEFFNDFVTSGGMQMHTAGSLRGGQMVWALAKINESFDVLGKDTVESYLLFSNPHKFGKSIDIRFTPIRVVCNNTLTLSLNTKANNMVKVSHRRAFDAEAVKETLGIAHDKLTKYKSMAEFLVQKRFNEDSIKEYFTTVFPVLTSKEKSRKELSKNAKLALEVMHTQPGAEIGEGTFWQAFNTVTFMTDHLLGRSADNRLMSAWYGSNKDLKAKALETAVEMANAA